MDTPMLIATIITAVATIVLAVFTGFYVHFTRQLAKGTNNLVKETKRMVDEMTRPDVVVGFKNCKNQSGVYFNIHFYVKNAGAQSVRKVRFEGDISFKPGQKALGDIPWVKSGIDVLAPGDTSSHSIYHSSKPYERDNFYENDDSKAKITIIFEDIFKTEHTNDFTLDLHKIDVNAR